MKIAKVVQRSVQTATAGIHIREAGAGEAESRVITGYAILFNAESALLGYEGGQEIREVIAPEAVTQELLDSSDIKFTMYHNREAILARSNKGQGTLTYTIDAKGVKFEFEAPKTARGDEALELVRRGDLTGCSFMFSTYYFDPDYVERKTEEVDGQKRTTYTVKQITGIYDFTLAADPAYPNTSVEAREFVRELSEATKEEDDTEEKDDTEKKEAPQDPENEGEENDENEGEGNGESDKDKESEAERQVREMRATARKELRIK